MAKSEQYMCDCGCKTTAAGKWELERWLTLHQFQEHSRTAQPKLGHEGDPLTVEGLYFSSFECLDRWVKGAMKIIPKMVRDASGLHPRGGFYNPDFPTLWF